MVRRRCFGPWCARAALLRERSIRCCDNTCNSSDGATQITVPSSAPPDGVDSGAQRRGTGRNGKGTEGMPKIGCVALSHIQAAIKSHYSRVVCIDGRVQDYSRGGVVCSITPLSIQYSGLPWRYCSVSSTAVGSQIHGSRAVVRCSARPRGINRAGGRPLGAGCWVLGAGRRTRAPVLYVRTYVCR